MSDKILFGIQITILCMSIVFLVLIGLSIVIRIQRAIVERLEGVSQKKGAPKVQKVVETQSTAAVKDEAAEDEELVAVISAAIAASLGRPASRIIVRAIRKIEPDAPAWNIAGRQDQISTRF